LQLLEEGRWAVEVDLLVLVQTCAEEPVEADEVVHVGVGHERVTDAEQFSGGQGLERPEIEQHRLPLEDEVNIERRVAEELVDELRPKALGHRRVGVPGRRPRRAGAPDFSALMV
jgi:hypothetical protein